MGRSCRYADRDVSGQEIDPRIRGWVESNVTHLEMRAPPDRRPVELKPGVEVRRAHAPTISFYRYLYNTVGGDWTWTGRRLMDDDALAAEIRDPNVEVNVLWVQGVPAGLMEIDRRAMPEIQLLYFGLIPDFVGKGYGRQALDWAVDRAWLLRSTRFWVHTCDLDHPNALSVYKKAGFAAYDHGTHCDPVLYDMSMPRRRGVAIPVDEITSSPGLQ